MTVGRHMMVVVGMMKRMVDMMEVHVLMVLLRALSIASRWRKHCKAESYPSDSSCG